MTNCVSRILERFGAATAQVTSIVVVGLLLAAGVPAQAAPPPSGSYLQTCQNAQANPISLKAFCQTRYGNFVRARLDYYSNCRGDIANMNGRLVCREIEGDITLYEHSNFRGRSLQVNSDVPALPRWFNDVASSIRVRRGSWQVCADFDFRGHCEIVRRDVEDLNRLDLNDRISSVRRAPARGPGGGGTPPGSYQQSCRNVTFDGRFLSAQCADRRGRYQDSRLDVRGCNRGDDIANRDGELVCEGRRQGGDNNGSNDGSDNDRDGHRGNGDGGYGHGNDANDLDNGRMPRGSYQQTCRNVRLDGDRLQAECQDRTGSWRRSSLDFGVCRGDIANDNGELKCGGANPTPPAPPPPGPPPPPAAPASADDISLGTPGFGGSGCPAGSVSATLSPDAKSLSLLFDQYIVSAGGTTGRAFDRKSCNVAIPVHVPGGYSLAVLAVDYRGFNHLPNQASSQFNVEYFFAGGRGPTFTRTFNGPLDSDYTINNQLGVEAMVWSPCGADVNLRTNASMRISTVNNAEATATVDSEDVNAAIVYHLQMRTCH